MTRDYKPTVLLPESDFPMKADLARREPEWLARWERDHLYDAILAQATQRKFVFHDGPPYANGHMHYGHVLNNALKDFVTRYRNIAGEHSRFIPGWDCHGLPIELNVDKALGAKKREMSATQVRETCRAEAQKWVDVQRVERKRVGVLGTWDAPYLTMAPGFEGAIVRALKAFVERGLIYRGKKPVQWCANDRTALAEAEVEYIEKHVSPSVYVRFAASEEAAASLRQRFPSTRATRFFAVIWTTTPWTLPANLAIALHPEVDYTVIDVERDGAVEGWLVAVPLAAALAGAARISFDDVQSNGAVKGEELVGLAFRHPWEDRASTLVPASYVETETGTGLVHTAPGHGRDDYNTGLKYNLEAYAPLDDAGRFTDELGAGSQALGLVGKSVWEANPIIVQAMAERGILVNAPTDKITHKYPGCWRCHKPLITRATTQWFIALDLPMKGDPDNKSLRERALLEIDRLAAEGANAKQGTDAQGWVPSWGRERIHGMIANRPDWCISRQRVWGVPIPALHCEKCNHATLSPALLDHVAKLFATNGADSWYDAKVQVAPEGFACEKCGSKGPFTRDASIVDVWFESGSSFYAVCEGPPDLGVPVDLYLEGSDQHRGWFHSSLLVGIAVTGRAPYRAVLTHGFIVDEKGQALSKSVINEMKARGEDVTHLDPLLMIKQQGAEVLRAWAAYEDYRGDVALSKDHFNQVAEAYRKIRNAFRFMLQVMRKKAPERLTDVTLQPLDAWVLARLSTLVGNFEAAYRAYEFRSVFVGAVEFLGDLSAFYLDVSKDWLYNDAEESPRRRSALATIDTVVRAVATMLAPILPFTAEDVWDHLPKRAGDPKSVHLTHWPKVATPNGVKALDDAATVLRSLREDVHGRLEPLIQKWGQERQAAKRDGRDSGTSAVAAAERIDHARDAWVTARVRSKDLDMLGPLRAVAAEAVLVGDLVLEAAEGERSIEVRRGETEPCARCWRRKRDVGAEGLCERCREAVRIYDAAAR